MQCLRNRESAGEKIHSVQKSVPKGHRVVTGWSNWQKHAQWAHTGSSKYLLCCSPSASVLWLGRTWFLLLKFYICLGTNALYLSVPDFLFGDKKIVCISNHLGGILTSIGKAFSLNLKAGESDSSTDPAGEHQWWWKPRMCTWCHLRTNLA